MHEQVVAKFILAIVLVCNINFHPPFRQDENMNGKWQMRKPNKSEAFRLSHYSYCMRKLLLNLFKLKMQVPCTFYLIFSLFDTLALA